MRSHSRIKPTIFTRPDFYNLKLVVFYGLAEGRWWRMKKQKGKSVALAKLPTWHDMDPGVGHW